jgi:hypothetical protein
MNRIVSAYYTHPSYTQLLEGKLSSWRDEAETTKQKVFRRIAASVGYVAIALFGAMEAAASLSLAAVTIPLHLFKVHISNDFFGRGFNALFFSAASATYFECVNVFEEKIS